jgi:hypothetical protein
MYKNVQVAPHWGEGQLTLSWEFTGDLEPDHNVIVFSALQDGVWINVTDQGELDPISGTFIHRTPLSVRRANTVLYKVIIQSGGQRYDSPSVSAGSELKPHEFAGIRTILMHECQDMRMGNGLEVLLLKPLTYGEPADSYDKATGQLMNPSSDESGYGERFRNGYFPPVRTMMQFVQQQDAEKRSQGVAISDSRIQARAFCFPRPAFRDLIINPKTDDRYLVNQVQTHRFNGIVPLMCDIQLDLLPRKDIRYKLDPDNVPDPTDNV